MDPNPGRVLEKAQEKLVERIRLKTQALNPALKPTHLSLPIKPAYKAYKSL